MGSKNHWFIAFCLASGTCCSGPDAPLDVGVDATDFDGQPQDSAPQVEADAPMVRDVVDASEALVDATFDESVWARIEVLHPDCGIRVARDPEATLGAWTMEPCLDGVTGCRALRRSSFSTELPLQMRFESVDAERAVLTFTSDPIETLLRVDYVVLGRSGATYLHLQNVFPFSPAEGCNLSGAALDAETMLLAVDDARLSTPDARGTTFPMVKWFFDSSRWTLLATPDYNSLFNYPQDLALSASLTAIRVAPSNRMLTVLNDGTYRFTEPAPPYDGVRVHSLPSVVGEHWVATGLMSGSANGIFMSRLGEPSIRIRDVDAVGEVVADETDIVWLEGSRLTEGIRLDGTTLWRAPWRPGPIDPTEARIVRPMEDVARIYPDVLNPGSAFLEMVLGGGHVAMHDQLVTACHVVRLSDGHMARFDPPGFTCTNVYHVNAEEIAVGVIEEGDPSFRSLQLWFVPLASLTFER